jgi:hypothetical protein
LRRIMPASLAAVSPDGPFDSNRQVSIAKSLPFAFRFAS